MKKKKHFFFYWDVKEKTIIQEKDEGPSTFIKLSIVEKDKMLEELKSIKS